MTLIGSLSTTPLFDVVDGGGGGGAGSNPGGNANPAGGGAPTSGGSNPQTYSLTDDSMIDLGDGKPVKFGDHVRGLKSLSTKATQEKAKLQKEYEDFKRAVEAERQKGQQRSQSGNGADIFESLKQLPYLTGRDAAEVIGQIAGAIQQRDQAIALMFKALQEVKKEVGGFSAKNAESEFKSKIAGFREKLGYGEDMTDILSELYLAYEGDDLDNEFPEIARKRIEQLQKTFRAMDQAKVQQAKKLPFIPGRGGQGTPSKPLQDKLTRASSGEIADLIWDGLDDTKT